MTLTILAAAETAAETATETAAKTQIQVQIDALIDADSHADGVDSDQRLSAYLADCVVTALIAEATLTPKPGLVDMRSRGAHLDLHWSLMCHSAEVLRPTFHAMALAGWTSQCSRRSNPNHEPNHEPNPDADTIQALREEIGRLGREGESCMMQATGGVNTHRGAIWALGLLVTAAAQEWAHVEAGVMGTVCITPGSQSDAALRIERIASRAAILACCADRFAPLSTGNKGELACQAYGVGGARQQARSGFPHVVQGALPCLINGRARGDSENTARRNVLLTIMATLDDTCVLSRGGVAALAVVQAGAAHILTLGGVGTAAGQEALQLWEADLLARKLSPGGAADMVAAALFLDEISGARNGKNAV